MATYNVRRAKHATLSAGVADTVNFSDTGLATRVRNNHASGVLYFTIDGTTTPSGADDDYVVYPGENVVIHVPGIPTIKLFSSAAVGYSVERVAKEIHASAGGSGGGGGGGAVTTDYQYAEDSAHASGSTGAFVLAVRNDAAATTLTSADGDYSPVATDAQGRVGVADLGGSISVDDNAGSLTVDNTVLSVTGGGTEAAAQRVTIANDSTGVLSVDDNGGSLTVDGTVSVSGAVDTELPAAAALADNTANPTVPGVGAFAMGFDGTNWDRVRADGGSVFIQDGGNVISVDDAAGSLTVDNSTLSVVGGGTEATAMRVTVANDSTGVLSVDDNGGSLTVDGTVAVSDGVDTVSVLTDGADNVANTENQLVTAAAGYSFDGSTWDRNRSSEAVAGNGALTETGIPVVSIGPGFAHRVNPADLASALNSTSTVDVNGASTFSVQVNTSTTGNVVVEATADGVTWVKIQTWWIDYGASPTSPWIPYNALQFQPVAGLTLSAPCATWRQMRLRVNSALGANMAHVFTLSQGAMHTVGLVAGSIPTNSAVASFFPVIVGGRGSTATPAAISDDGDARDAWYSRQGVAMTSMAPHLGLMGTQPWNLVHKGAQYTTQQTSTVFQAGAATEKIVVTQVQIQAFGTTAFDLQLYFGTGAFSRGTNRTIFDGTFKPSTTLAPGYTSQGPFISGTNDDDLMVTTSAAGSVTISVWYYVVT